jgi:peptidoglycan/xylan/chitin deacetylase (PgdA/CDA1 family)
MTVSARLWRTLARVDQYTGASKHLPDTSNVVLRYHSVGGSGYEDLTRERFRADLAALTEAYEVVDLPEAVADAAAPTKQVAVTFDDGYETFATTVLPLLEEFDVPATVFVIADAIGDPTFQHDPPEHVDTYLSRSQLDDLVAHDLVTIGNHTRTHSRLPTLAEGDLVAEIRGAQTELEDRLGTTIDRFSYPYGAYDHRALDVVRDTHEYAVTVADDHLPREPDRYRLPRENGARSTAMLRWRLTETSRTVRSLFG